MVQYGNLDAGVLFWSSRCSCFSVLSARVRESTVPWVGLLLRQICSTPWVTALGPSGAVLEGARFARPLPGQPSPSSSFLYCGAAPSPPSGALQGLPAVPLVRAPQGSAPHSRGPQRSLLRDPQVSPSITLTSQSREPLWSSCSSLVPCGQGSGLQEKARHLQASHSRSQGANLICFYSLLVIF